MLRKIGPSIDPWDSPNRLEIGLYMNLSILTKCVLSLK